MKKFKKILLIDDDDINNYVTAKFIKKANIGETADTVLNGSRGLAYLDDCEKEAKTFPDLIIVDLSMPIMNGEEFLKEYEATFWKKHQETKLVVITASIREEDKIQALSYQCISGFLSKPIDGDKLKELLV